MSPERRTLRCTQDFGGRSLFVCRVSDSLQSADAFPVVASLPPKNSVAIFRRERGDDRKCVCASQARFQIPLVQEGGRERLISTPRPYVTDPFHLSSAAKPQPSEGRAIVFQLFQPYSTYNYVLVRCIYSKSL